MATGTYAPIASITLSSNTPSVTFSSIPQYYRDLVLVVRGRGSSADNFYYLYLNADTGSNYSRVEMFGTGSASNSSSAGNLIPITLTSGSENINTAQILDYSTTDKHKTVLWRNDATVSSGARVLAGVGRWANTSAVNTLEIEGFSGVTLLAGSILSLYGIEA